MADSNAPATTPLSPANMMAEALDKASQELEKTVKACLDQLQSFNENLEKSLATQLQKVVEQSKNFVESNIEDLSTHREELVDRLLEFERSEIETMVSAARDVRQQVSARALQASEVISRLVEEQVTELRALIENPEHNFKDFSTINQRTLEHNTHAGKERVAAEQLDCETKLTAKAQELEQAVLQVVAESRKSIEETLEKFNGEMEKKISSVLSQLSEVVDHTVDELETGSAEGAEKIQKSVDEGAVRLSDHLNSWKDECNDLRKNFEDTLQQDSETAEKAHTSKLELKVGEVKDEINNIAQDATAKIAASHKLFFSSLKRLEKKYNDRLERLMSRFEAALADEPKLASGSMTQPSAELREQLHARLQARGKDILKTFQRQVEQLEAEYIRQSGSSHERVDAIRTAATETLDKQLRTMKSELERISRNFKSELTDLHNELPKIEERGRAAAMTVQAYRSTMLSVLDN
jgi:uncharacterized protein YukE